jgi:anti-sigma regulatory factor (Ser/Thr protein kinase)
MSGRRQQTRFMLSSSLSELERLHTTLEQLKSDWQLPDTFTLQLNLVLDELFTNVVSYGFDNEPDQSVDFSLIHRGDSVEVTICDHGKPFDPTAADSPDLHVPLDKKQTGGLGIFLARRYVDTLSYRRAEDKNILTLTKKI